MNRQPPPLGVRLPEDLKQWLRQSATTSRRSMNSELIIRLEEARRQDQQSKVYSEPQL